MEAVLHGTLSHRVDLVNRVNIELEHVHCWLQAKRIRLNTEKTKYIVFKYRKMQ